MAGGLSEPDHPGPSTSNLSFGAPAQLIFGLLGAPGNALSALNSTGVAFAGAVQAGNASAAAARPDAGLESCQALRQTAAPVNTEVCLIFLACVLSLWSAAPRHT